MTGNISTIWPMFGVANQLLSVIALAVGTTYILRKAAKPSYALITFLPMVFMLVTTLAAAWSNVFGNYLPRHNPQGYINAGLTVVMALLVIIITIESARKWIGELKADQHA